MKLRLNDFIERSKNATRFLLTGYLEETPAYEILIDDSGRRIQILREGKEFAQRELNGDDLVNGRDVTARGIPLFCPRINSPFATHWQKIGIRCQYFGTDEYFKLWILACLLEYAFCSTISPPSFKIQSNRHAEIKITKISLRAFKDEIGEYQIQSAEMHQKRTKAN